MVNQWFGMEAPSLKKKKIQDVMTGLHIKYSTCKTVC